jgi:hypothetical protein
VRRSQRARRLVTWACKPSIWRALGCGFVAIYVGMFFGADPVTMFIVAQLARLAVRFGGLPRILRRRRPEAESALGAETVFAPASPEATSAARAEGSGSEDTDAGVAGEVAERRPAHSSPSPRTAVGHQAPLIFEADESTVPLEEMLDLDPGPEAEDPGPDSHPESAEGGDGYGEEELPSEELEPESDLEKAPGDEEVRESDLQIKPWVDGCVMAVGAGERVLGVGRTAEEARDRALAGS